jgi:putative addiction module CopG family antidote
MRTTQSLSITLPHEMAQMVKAKVASGEYATESEVIRDGLRVLAARDAAVEKWLQDEVVPAYDAVISNPDSALSAGEAWARIQAHMDARDALPGDASR